MKPALQVLLIVPILTAEHQCYFAQLCVLASGQNPIFLKLLHTRASQLGLVCILQIGKDGSDVIANNLSRCIPSKLSLTSYFA